MAPVSQTMDHPGIGVEIKDNWLIEREQTVKVAIGQTVRMLCIRLQPEEIHDVKKPDLQVRELVSQEAQLRREPSRVGTSPAVAITDIWFDALVIACPVPEPDSLRAVSNRRLHVQILKVELLIANDHVNVVLAPKTVIGDR